MILYTFNRKPEEYNLLFRETLLRLSLEHIFVFRFIGEEKVTRTTNKI